jgi:putative YphP/YqiW family bacilliredoxin
MKIDINMYDPNMVRPMKEEAISMGFRELLTVSDVNNEIIKKGYTLVFVNSVCGCAVGKARPGLKLALKYAGENNCVPDNLLTVFAGVDREAVTEARKYFEGFVPTSPQIALLRDGKLISLIQRNETENSDEHRVAELVVNLLKEHVKRSNYGQ